MEQENLDFVKDKIENSYYLTYITNKDSLPTEKYSYMLTGDLKDLLPFTFEEDGKYINLSERQAFWNQVLNLGQWLLLGKDTRDCMEYERLVNEIEDDLPARLNFPTNLEYNSYACADDGDTKRKTKKRRSLSKLESSYYYYLHEEDVLVNSNRKFLEGNVPESLDAQALEQALNELTDLDSPFNAKRFIHFLEPSKTEYTINSLSLDAFSNIFDIKKNMLKEDWARIKDLYATLKVAGVVEVKRVYEEILLCAVESFPTSSASKWYDKIGCKRKLAALKLGSLFLSIFHVCYLDACLEIPFEILKECISSSNLSIDYANQQIKQNPPKQNLSQPTIQKQTQSKTCQQQRKLGPIKRAEAVQKNPTQNPLLSNEKINLCKLETKTKWNSLSKIKPVYKQEVSSLKKNVKKK